MGRAGTAGAHRTAPRCIRSRRAAPGPATSQLTALHPGGRKKKKEKAEEKEHLWRGERVGELSGGRDVGEDPRGG